MSAGRPPRPVARLVALLAAVALAGAGCGLNSDSGPRDLAADEVPSDLLAPRAETTTTTSTTLPPLVSREVTVYLVGADGRLAPVARTVPDPGGIQQAVEALLEGATDDEAARGLRSVIRPETDLLGVQRREGIVVLDFTRDFTVPRGEEGVTAFAQVVFTVTSFDGVTGVLFSLEGTEIEAPKGDGTLTRGPVTRFSYPTREPLPPSTTTTGAEAATG